MSKYVKKLGSDTSYKRPKKTFQEQLSAEDISAKLQGYEKVDDIAEVPLHTHMRYFTTKPDGTQVFRTGGILHNKQNADKYVMLSNGTNIWSVQVKNTVFFKKMSHDDELNAVHELYKKKLAEKDLIIDKLKKYIRLKISTNDIIINEDENIYKPTVEPRYIASQNIPKNTSRRDPNRTTSTKYKSSGSKTSNPTKFPNNSSQKTTKKSSIKKY